MRSVLACVAVAAVCCATGAASGASSIEPKVAALAVLPGPIRAFTQDGPRLAWADRAGITVLDIRSHRRTALGPACSARREAIAIAEKRVVWVGDSISGPDAHRVIEVERCVATATTDARRARSLGRGFLAGEYPEDWPWPRALVAGDGATLVFDWVDGGSEVRRVVGSKAIRLFKVDFPASLAADDVTFPADAQARAEALAAAGDALAVADKALTCACNVAPEWSLDGSTIAWGRSGAVYVMEADGTGQRRVSPLGGAGSVIDGPRWSPDGTRLAYVLGRPRQPQSWAVHLVGADGTGHLLLGRGGEPSWSPTGSELSFVRGGGIWIVEADGSRERAVTSGEAWGGDWSPDGTRLVAARRTEVYVMRSDGTGETRIVPAAGLGRRAGLPSATRSRSSATAGSKWSMRTGAAGSNSSTTFLWGTRHGIEPEGGWQRRTSRDTSTSSRPQAGPRATSGRGASRCSTPPGRPTAAHSSS